MKRNVQIWLTLSAIVAVSALVFAGCNGQGDHSNQMHDGDMHSGMDNGTMEGGMHHSMMHKTKQLKLGKISVTADFMNMAEHNRMMDSMGMEQHHQNMGPDDLHVMVTVQDESGENVLRDAKVDVKVTDPSGKEAKVYPVTMSNQSMHHEGYSFKSAGAGTYKVQISVENKGDKESGSLEFNL